MGTDIELRVEVADVLVRPSDLLVLKYAQFAFGADKAVADALALKPGAMPIEGAHLLVPAHGPLGVRHVLFLGVAAIDRFDYRTAREIGRRALAAACDEVPQVKEICLTMHGIGFGLDEAEAFDSEVAGVLDAIGAGTYPPGLDAVVFVERDRGRANRMQQRLRRLLPSQRVTIGRPLGPALDPMSVDHMRSVGYDSESKRHAFVAMPFDPSFEDVFYYGIAPPIRAAGLLCERVDQITFTGDVVVQLKERIGRAEFLVADLTGANPNVYLEVGYAWGRGVPAVLLCDKVDDLRFDVRGHRCVLYSSIRDLESKLEKEISGLLPAGNRPDR